jgi:hypothetical protein
VTYLPILPQPWRSSCLIPSNPHKIFWLRWRSTTPLELERRVFAVRRLIAQFTAPLGTALAGWTGGQFDPGAVIASLGIIL